MYLLERESAPWKRRSFDKAGNHCPHACGKPIRGLPACLLSDRRQPHHRPLPAQQPRSWQFASGIEFGNRWERTARRILDEAWKGASGVSRADRHLPRIIQLAWVIGICITPCAICFDRPAFQPLTQSGVSMIGVERAEHDPASMEQEKIAIVLE